MTATQTQAEPRPTQAPLQLLEGAVEPVLRDLGYDLVLLEWDGGGRRTLRLYIDRADGNPVSVEDCARVSRVVGQSIEAAEVAEPAVGILLRGAYHLEVSSPGIERPLARRSHFDRFRGRRAKVRLRTPLEPNGTRRTFTGRIEGTEPQTGVVPGSPEDERQGWLLLRPDDEHNLDTGGTLRLPLRAIARAHLVYEG